jgi:hypothetical protein
MKTQRYGEVNEKSYIEKFQAFYKRSMIYILSETMTYYPIERDGKSIIQVGQR